MFRRLTGFLAGGSAAAMLVSTTAAPRQAPAAAAPWLSALATVPVPAATGAAEPNLAADATGRIWLSWLEPRPGGGHLFRLSALEGATWSPPVTIAEGAAFVANWADFPSVFAAADGTLAAHWLERGADRAAYGIRIATSRDGGRTWSAPAIPHRTAPTGGEYGFVSFFDAPGGGVGLAWLDGRGMADHGAAHGSMALRATMLRAGAPGEEALVDPRVCDCCQTSAARTPSGVVVAYRDRSDREIRDISVVALRNGRWTTPRTAHADNWEIHGCPVNGPAIAASGPAVAVAWFTRAGDVPRAQVAFSPDEGATFGAPIRLGDDAAQGRVGVVMPDPERALVSSLEKAEAGGRLVIREVRRDGRVSGPVVVTATTTERASGFARLALGGRRLVVAWTEAQPGAPTRIATAMATVR